MFSYKVLLKLNFLKTTSGVDLVLLWLNFISELRTFSLFVLSNLEVACSWLVQSQSRT